MRERMLAGELYQADDDGLTRDMARAATLTHRLNSADPADGELRRGLLTELLGRFGEGSEIRPPFQCDYGYHTFVGARTFVNFGLISLDVARVTIGDDVQIGPNVQLLTPWHPVAAGPRRDKWEAASPIVIGEAASHLSRRGPAATGCHGVSSCTLGPICTSSPIVTGATSRLISPKFAKVRAPTKVW